MTGATHLAAGVLLGVAATGDLTATIGVAIGSLLPDIDSPKSIVGRYIPILPRLIKHRTWTHSLWMVIALFLLWPPLGIGVLSHLLLDSVTKDGVRPVWPCAWRLRLPPGVRSGGTVDWVLGIICTLVAAWLAWEILMKGLI